MSDIYSQENIKRKNKFMKFLTIGMITVSLGMAGIGVANGINPQQEEMYQAGPQSSYVVTNDAKTIRMGHDVKVDRKVVKANDEAEALKVGELSFVDKLNLLLDGKQYTSTNVGKKIEFGEKETQIVFGTMNKKEGDFLKYNATISYNLEDGSHIPEVVSFGSDSKIVLDVVQRAAAEKFQQEGGENFVKNINQNAAEIVKIANIKIKEQIPEWESPIKSVSFTKLELRDTNNLKYTSANGKIEVSYKIDYNDSQLQSKISKFEDEIEDLSKDSISAAEFNKDLAKSYSVINKKIELLDSSYSSKLEKKEVLEKIQSLRAESKAQSKIKNKIS
jgi:hypothetical protein